MSKSLPMADFLFVKAKAVYEEPGAASGIAG